MDIAPIIRTIKGVRGEGDLIQRRWSWPGPNKRPVYNFQSEGREFTSNLCLTVADGFYEFTDPADTKKKRKDKWLLTKVEEPILCIVGIWWELVRGLRHLLDPWGERELACRLLTAR
jgi:putative SOS response-associated peptidase YedK